MKIFNILTGVITILMFIFLLFPSFLKEVLKMDPYRLGVLCVFITCSIYWIYLLIRFLIKHRKPLKSLNKNLIHSKGILSPKKVIYDPTKHPEPQFLVDGNNYFWIPNPETFNYLAKLFGFWWDTSEPMLPDDIESKFVKGEDLPKIQDFLPPK